jgi:hypothetical protein
MCDSKATINNLIIKIGDLLEADEQYICQQCNCSSSNYKGLSKSIVEAFPWACFYSERNREPGTIMIKGDEKKSERPVIAMFAQRYIGPAKFASDTANMRLIWFEKCLKQIGELEGLESIAFPYNIGCGLAGGEWSAYLRLLENFATQNSNIKIVIYQLKST